MSKEVFKVKLKDNNEIPVVGLGTWRLFGKECISIVEKSIEMDYTQFDTAQMYINGVPGRYRRIHNEYVFEEGRFCQNACCNLRIEDLLKILNENQVDQVQSMERNGI